MNIAYKVVITLFAILIGSVIVNTPADYVLSFVLILTFGIPHGATDHILNNVTTGNSMNARPSSRFSRNYLLTIIGYGLVWYFFPSFSLLFFLMISAFHFGETQYQPLQTRHKVLKLVAGYAWGSAVLSILLLSDGVALTDFIVPHLAPANLLSEVLNYKILIIFSLVGFTLLCSYLISLSTSLKEAIEIGLIVILSHYTSLLFSFAIFFVFWHSRDAISHQLQKFNMFEMKMGLKQWIRLALPYTIASVLGIGFLLIAFFYFYIQIPLVTAFFILVSLITLPHVMVMSAFYRRVSHVH